jgi:hypothetical protein
MIYDPLAELTRLIIPWDPAGYEPFPDAQGCRPKPHRLLKEAPH